MTTEHGYKVYVDPEVLKIQADLELLKQKLILFCFNADERIEHLCKDVNDRMEWMRVGVALCIACSMSAVLGMLVMVYR